jgi:hypothetical protein
VISAYFMLISVNVLVIRIIVNVFMHIVILFDKIDELYAHFLIILSEFILDFFKLRMVNAVAFLEPFALLKYIGFETFPLFNGVILIWVLPKHLLHGPK